jgi:anti-anti-sigma factor
MEFRSSRKHGVLIYHIKGYLTDDAHSYELVRHVRQRIAAENKKIIVDLSGVDLINSSGIGVIATIITSSKNAEVDLLFAAIPRNVEQIMAIVGLTHVMKTFPTLDEALAAFPED